MMIGDRVKLRQDLAEQFSIDRFGHRKKADWAKRIGSVIALPKACNPTGQITIRWDDRRSPDWWPEKALELIDL